VSIFELTVGIARPHHGSPPIRSIHDERNSVGAFRGGVGIASSSRTVCTPISAYWPELRCVARLWFPTSGPGARPRPGFGHRAGDRLPADAARRSRPRARGG
jgi:hypothetical protein